MHLLEKKLRALLVHGDGGGRSRAGSERRAGEGPRAQAPYGSGSQASEATSQNLHSLLADHPNLPPEAKASIVDWEEFGNRLLVHNITLRITNVGRDILLAYIYSRRERKAESCASCSPRIRRLD